MNYSDYSLHGISPFYDQTIFVRCHLCRNIVKLPQLADHLDKRHQNVNNGKISKDILQVNTNEQFDSTALHNHYNSSEIQNNGNSAKKGRKSNSSNSDSLKQNETKSKVAQLTKNRNKANRKPILNESLTANSEITNEKQINTSISIKENGNSSAKSTNCNDSLNDSLTVAFTESFDNSNIENKINLACENLKINGAEKSDFDLKKVDIVGSHIQASSNNNINTNKLLPKIIIKKDKSSTNTQVFYLNNIQISSRPQQPQQNQNDSKINENNNPVALSNEYKESNEMFKHYTNQSNLISPKSQSKGKSSCSTATMTKSFKSYDPNKHCGVIVKTFDPVTEKKLTEEHCTRSLSCKKHSVSLRRQVIGRSKSFNELFKEQRNEKSILSSSVGDNSSHKNNETFNYDNVTTAADQQQQIKTPRKNHRKKPSTSETLPLLSDANLITDGLSHDQANQILNDKINHEKSHNKNKFNHHHQNNTSLNNTLYTLNNHSEIFSNQMNNKCDIRHSSFIPPEQRFIANSLTPSTSEPTKNKAQHTNNNKIFTSPETLNTKNNQLKLIKNTPPPAELNSANLNKNLNSLNLNFSNSMLSKHHPRPSAVTSFNARLTDNGGGHTLWNRKQDNLRLILSNAFSQTSNFLDKNRCFTPSNAGTITESFNGTNFKDQINTQKDNLNSLIANQPTSSLHCLHQQFHNDEIQSENPNEINYSRFESFIQNTKINSEKLIKKRSISNTQTDLHQQSLVNQTTNYLDDNQKPKLKKTGLYHAHDELLNLQPPSAKLAKLNQEKSTLVSLISSNNKNFNQINTKKTLNLNLKSSFDGINHSDRNQLNSIEISKNTNAAGFASHSNHCHIQNDRLLTNLNSKESQKQQKQHQHLTANDITAAAYRKYPLATASFISFKNPITNSKTLNSFLQNEDVDENDDDIVEITPMTKNYNLSKINSTNVISTSNETNFHFIQNNDINDDNLSKNIACNNRQQKKSVSLSPSPSSSSSSSTISSINLNSANGNTACLLNTIN